MAREDWLRASKLKGAFGTLAWGSLAVVGLYLELLLREVVSGDPAVLAALGNVRVNLAGSRVVALGVLGAFAGFCALRAALSWASGVVPGLVQLFVLVALAWWVLEPVAGVRVEVLLPGVRFELFASLEFLFWLLAFVQLVVLGLDVGRLLAGRGIDAKFSRGKRAPGAPGAPGEPGTDAASDLPPAVAGPPPPRWLDVDEGTPVLEPGDVALVPAWLPVRARTGTTLKQRARRLLVLYACVSAYAAAAFVLVDAGRPPYDATVGALLLPAVGYALLAFRSFRHLVGGALVTVAVALYVAFPLLERGLATADAFLFTWAFFRAADFAHAALVFLAFVNDPTAFVDLGGFHVPAWVARPFDPTDVELVERALLFLTNWFLLAEFALYAAYGLVRLARSGSKRTELAVTRRNVYLRTPPARSDFDALRDALFILYAPLNVNAYREAIRRVRYRRESRREGATHDHLFVPKAGGAKFRRSRAVPKRQVLGAAFFALLGSLNYATTAVPLDVGSYLPFSLPAFFRVASPFFLVAFALAFNAVRRRGKWRVRVELDRSKAEGSWLLARPDDVVVLGNLDAGLANCFPPGVDPATFPDDQG
ncbi:MAG: hypothetical protein Kow0069_19610 [Promethearchaeota archaeon]